MKKVGIIVRKCIIKLECTWRSQTSAKMAEKILDLDGDPDQSQNVLFLTFPKNVIKVRSVVFE